MSEKGRPNRPLAAMRSDNDYLILHLQTDEAARKEILREMIHNLEASGDCRAVYHRLALVLIGDDLT